MNFILKFFGTVFILILLTLGVSYFYLDRILTETVVRLGPEVTGTEVSLDSATLSPLNGRGSLSGFSVGNPEGYNAEHAFSVDSVKLSLDPMSLNSDVILIHSLDIIAPQISYESGDDIDNLQKLQQMIEERLDVSATSEEETGTEVKIIIEKFTLQDGKINAQHSLLGDKVFDVDLPDLLLTDIGKKSQGATLREAAGQIFSAITESAKSAVGNSEIFSQAISQFKNKVKDSVKESIDAIKNLDLGEAKDKVKSLLKGFGN